MLRLPPLYVIDRVTGKREREAIYGEQGLALLYNGGFWTYPLKILLTKNALFSRFYGWLQASSGSKKKVAPFVKKYGLDPSEFEKKMEDFTSFNDFFTRKLKPKARPICEGPACMPADGRYRFFPVIEDGECFTIKGQHFCLSRFLGDEWLAHSYVGGAMLLARLCPTDYHRFHFPCDGTPGKSRLINGTLASVNPFALDKSLSILTENKRMICTLESPQFGEVLIVEIGATNVGTISQTYTPGKPVEKGEEKGFFSFGGSAMALLFKPNQVSFSEDLLVEQNLEIKCQMGQLLVATNS